MTKNQTIEQYLKAQTKVHGLGSVILLPEFEGSDETGWTPVGDGVRGTKNDGQSFIRLGSVVLGDGMNVRIRLTNAFQPTDNLRDTLNMLGITAGSKVPGKLRVHERLEPFSRTQPSRDLKWADQKAGIPCLYDDQPIYRRIEHTTDVNAVDIRIQHTNGAQISEHARSVWAANNVSSTGGGIIDAGKKAARLAELKAIPKAKRTPEQVTELADLMED